MVPVRSFFVEIQNAGRYDLLPEGQERQLQKTLPGE